MSIYLDQHRFEKAKSCNKISLFFEVIRYKFASCAILNTSQRVIFVAANITVFTEN
jgi:hypothetical protein